MKKLLSLILVAVMLICMIPAMNVSAAYIQDEIPGFIGTGYYWDRLCVFDINTNGGHFNANSGATSNMNGSAAVAANALNIADGFSGTFSVYVYQAANTPADAAFNYYIGVIYYNGYCVSPTFYYLGDLMTVIYNSLEYDGYTLTSLNLEGNADFTPTEFANGLIAQAILTGATYTYTAQWEADAPAEYTLTFDVNGGTMPSGYNTTYTFTDGQLFVDVIGGYPVPSKSGYTFAGWMRSDYSADLWVDGWGTQPYTFAQNITLVAQWEEEVVETPECENHSFTNNVCTVCGAAFQTSYTVGDYIYTYADSNKLGASAGWNVVVTDTTKSSYSAINATLHGIPVTILSKTYDGCSNMTAAPVIPATVEVLYNAYKGTAITATPTIPSSVVKVYGAFKNCKSLTTITNLPESITDMTFAFSNCSALKNLPAIPANVISLWGAFRNCTALASVSIPEGVENMVEAFDGCTSLTGSVTLSTNNNKRAFRNTAVTDITITADVTHFALSCFKTTGAIKIVNYKGAATAWNDITYEGYNTKIFAATVKTDTIASEPTVEVANGKTYICDIDPDNLRDVFIGKGHAIAYRGVAMNKVVGITHVKINGANVYTYNKALTAGKYTLCVRYNDGTSNIYNFVIE